MENAVVKTSNLSDIISKFAKVCKFRPVGVFPGHPKPSPNTPCDKVAETFEEDDKANNETITNCKLSRKIPTFRWDDDNEISKVFDTVSALKLAYLEFQQAHMPYDPDKIIQADNLVVSHLETLRRFKRLYLKTKKQLQAKTELRDEVEMNEKILEKLKAQMKAKESEIHSLKEKLNSLVTENKKLIVSVSSFEFVFRAASKSIHDFAKPLITLMKATEDWNLEKAVESIVGNVTYAKNSDKKFAFESYIVQRMFHGMMTLNNPSDVTELMSLDDPLDALTAFPDSAFARFCGEKYLLVVHPLMEASFFGNLDMRGLVLLGKHPRTVFYRIFAKMARWVWVLGSFAASLDVKAKIFVVRRGTRFSSVYMESVVGGDAKEEEDLRVEFITMPGFKVGDSVFKSHVYLSQIKR